MAFSKAHRFDPSDYHYSLICRALAHPARLAIIRQLYTNGECEVKELLAGKPISPASLSQHLRILREMHIVNSEQIYPTVRYALNTGLPNTYNSIVDLVIRAGTHFDHLHLAEMETVSRITRATASGV